MSSLLDLIHRAESDIGISTIATAVGVVIWHFISRALGRIDASSAQIARLASQIAVQQNEIKAAWRNIEELKKEIKEIRNRE